MNDRFSADTAHHKGEVKSKILILAAAICEKWIFQWEFLFAILRRLQQSAWHTRSGILAYQKTQTEVNLAIAAQLQRCQRSQVGIRGTVHHMKHQRTQCACPKTQDMENQILSYKPPHTRGVNKLTTKQQRQQHELKLKLLTAQDLPLIVWKTHLYLALYIWDQANKNAVPITSEN